MRSKHILLIYAGGTIGMQPTAQGLAPMPDFSQVLQALLARRAAHLPRCTLQAYGEPIDSSNATPAEWQTIAHDIVAHYDAYDGFVVLHGTDTLAYTAAALSFMLRGLRKPVVLTGAQVPLQALGSDAEPNLLRSLQAAASEELSEVAICFGGRLLRGNRASKCSSVDVAAFDSPNHPWLGEIGNTVAWRKTALLPRPEREQFALPAYRSGEVMSLRFAPGLSLRLLEATLALAPKALILECYGTGNVPDRDPRLLALLERVCADGMVLAACSQARHGGVRLGSYAAGAGLPSIGVIGAGDMVFEALYAKLHHLLALDLPVQDIRRQLMKSWCGEVSATERSAAERSA